MRTVKKIFNRLIGKKPSPLHAYDDAIRPVRQFADENIIPDIIANPYDISAVQKMVGICLSKHQKRSRDAEKLSAAFDHYLQSQDTQNAGVVISALDNISAHEADLGQTMMTEEQIKMIRSAFDAIDDIASRFEAMRHMVEEANRQSFNSMMVSITVESYAAASAKLIDAYDREYISAARKKRDIQNQTEAQACRDFLVHHLPDMVQAAEEHQQTSEKLEKYRQKIQEACRGLIEEMSTLINVDGEETEAMQKLGMLLPRFEDAEKKYHKMLKDIKACHQGLRDSVSAVKPIAFKKDSDDKAITP